VTRSSKPPGQEPGQTPGSKHLRRQLWLFCYRWLLWPLLRAVFYFASLARPKVRRGIAMRELRQALRPPWAQGPKGQRPVWIHCASGEFEYAKPVIEKIKELNPRAKILLTYFSPSYAEAVHRYPGVDFASPSPWENRRSMRELIEHHQPQALLLARTDTWPEMLASARDHGIRSLLFSATIARESGRARGVMKFLSRLILDDLTQIYCVSEEDSKIFAQLGCGHKTRVAGDTRYDQVMQRLRAPRPLKDTLFTSRSKAILIAGSTWPEDEEILTDALVIAKKQHAPQPGLVIVPHEPSADHLLALEQRIAERGLTSARYSRVEEWTSEDILLVDQVGILAELYQKGNFAFVGGSFRKTVHSVMEPLACGALTIVGPKYLNNREAIEFRTLTCATTTEKDLGSESFHCVEVVRDATEMASLLLRARAKFSASDASAILRHIQARSGKATLVAEWALSHWSDQAR
jgi:3-deoxy-D-manno-octulosonic-acid transferase